MTSRSRPQRRLRGRRAAGAGGHPDAGSGACRWCRLRRTARIRPREQVDEFWPVAASNSLTSCELPEGPHRAYPDRDRVHQSLTGSSRRLAESRRTRKPGWTMPYGVPESYAFKLKETLDAQSLLLGRVTYEGFAAAWPGREGDGSPTR